MRADHLGKQTRVQALMGHRRTWRTLWLRAEPLWETCWYGIATGYERDMRGGRIVIGDVSTHLRREARP